jgi:AraC-like DNA-binding protein
VPPPSAGLRIYPRIEGTHGCAEETGLTFADGRQQARLLAAMALLAAGHPIILELGYDSPSAFAAMFKRTLGAPPSRYFARTSGMLNA